MFGEVREYWIKSIMVEMPMVLPSVMVVINKIFYVVMGTNVFYILKSTSVVINLLSVYLIWIFMVDFHSIHRPGVIYEL